MFIDIFTYLLDATTSGFFAYLKQIKKNIFKKIQRREKCDRNHEGKTSREVPFNTEIWEDAPNFFYIQKVVWKCFFSEYVSWKNIKTKTVIGNYKRDQFTNIQ